ncbi:hypothetical protein GH714_003226 [Hevea brasiliensis]|uniref:Transcription factor CBF/NF-Y/archaeal histone domain-containing protein n=1 Tax=Hevea brasiliensis TaxID=3981 RepID=A0A6A6MAF5_HEVBR|nr:hypothetical protein GH714_003226 [Hevea brasiliensis]
MDQRGHAQASAAGEVGSTAPVPYGISSYQPKQMMGPAASGSLQSAAQPSGVAASQAQHQLAYQHIHQQQQEQLQQQLQTFWTNQYQEIEQATDFKNHSLPLARIKKIMKADEDVRMISAEAPVIFARAFDIVPREDLKDEVLASVPRGSLPVGGPAEAIPYYYMSPQFAPQVAAPGMSVGQPVVDQNLYGQQTRPYVTQPIWPQQQQQPPSDS